MSPKAIEVKVLDNYKIEIKQIKRQVKEDKEEKGETVHIVGHYNKKSFKKNELLRNITAIENIQEILEDES